MFNDTYVTYTLSRPLDCGTQNSYVISLDTEFDIINAWSTGSSDLVYHGGNIKSQTFILNSDGTCTSSGGGDDGGGVDHDKVYSAHGMFMWIGWCLISIMQVYTNRYLRHKWTWRQYLHSILGIFVLILTILAFILALWMSGWKLIFDFTHNLIGFPMFLLGSLLCIGGMVTSVIKFRIPFAWSTRKKLILSKGHGYFGYLVLLFG